MKIRAIDRPVWAGQPDMTSDGVPNDVLERLRLARQRLLDVVHGEVMAYLSRPENVFKNADQFPSLPRLNGDYYIGDEWCRFDADNKRYQISIFVRCLAHPLPSQHAPDDYLGLDVWLQTTSACDAFSVMSIDSSVI